MIRRAVAPPPVKLILPTRGSPTSAAPASAPPGTTLTTPGGRPASRQSSAKRSGPSGASSAGLSTTQLPAASAGATFIAGETIPPFHGVSTATTPYGSSRRVVEGRTGRRRHRRALQLVDPPGVVAHVLGRQRCAAPALERRAGLQASASPRGAGSLASMQAGQLERARRAAVPAPTATTRRRRRWRRRSPGRPRPGRPSPRSPAARRSTG